MRHSRNVVLWPGRCRLCRAHDGHAPAPGPRRRRAVDGPGCGRQPRASPPRRPRPFRQRPSADGFAERALRPDVQRRNLQSSRLADGAGGARRARMARPFGHRNAARSDRLLGARASVARMRRHVRARALGPAGAHALPGARPLRREAALLWARRRRLPVRLRAEGDPRASGLRGGDRPRRAQPVRGARLRAGAPVHLPRHFEAHAGDDPHGERSRRNRRALLVLSRDRRGRPGRPPAR